MLAAAGNIFDFFYKNTKPANAADIKSKLVGDLGVTIGPEVKSLAEAEAGKEDRMENYKKPCWAANVRSTTIRSGLTEILTKLERACEKDKTREFESLLNQVREEK